MFIKEVFAVKSLFCIPNFVLVILATLLGAASALVWYFGLIQFVREMIPYALAFAVVLFAVTAILKAKCGNMNGEVLCLTSTCSSLRKYSPIIFVSALLFIVFAIIVLATFLPFVVRIILAIIGSISFWTLLLSFAAMLFCIMYRR